MYPSLNEPNPSQMNFKKQVPPSDLSDEDESYVQETKQKMMIDSYLTILISNISNAIFNSTLSCYLLTPWIFLVWSRATVFIVFVNTSLPALLPTFLSTLLSTFLFASLSTSLPNFLDNFDL